MIRALLVCLALLGLAPALRAHEVRPAYLELRQRTAEDWDVLWKVPGRGTELRLGLYVEFPPSCSNTSEPRVTLLAGAFAERWSVRAPGGLAGGTIRIAGLAATLTDVLARVERLDGSTQVARLSPAAPAFVVAAAPRTSDLVRAYAVLGVEHILTGIDHLLFVLALLILTRGGWTLVKTVSAFTLSHSLTLAAATLGWVHVSQAPVEAAIALSIVFVAAEILRQRAGQEGIAARAPWLVAFSFGLLHGLGFAGGLSEAGLPAGHVPEALLFFSIGVELGHFLFLGTVLALVALARRTALRAPIWSRPAPAYAIGSLAMFWVIQRVGEF